MPTLAALADLARGYGGSGEPAVLSQRSDRLVVRVGGLVLKVHAEGAAAAELTARVAAAAALPGVLLAPVGGPVPIGDRLVTAWPLAAPVAGTDPDTAPWAAGAALLAALHRTPAPPLPPTSGPLGVARAADRLAGLAHPAAAVVRRAFAALPGRVRGEPAAGPALVHGDWHFGQLARPRRVTAPGGDGPAAADGWRLIDVDDLGTGDPAWDLARPAALYAVGLLDGATWWAFVDSYRAAGGPALTADPWERLDVPARALVVRLAAQAVAAAADGDRAVDEIGSVFVDACMRMAR